jgi:hypothetical protein
LTKHSFLLHHCRKTGPNTSLQSGGWNAHIHASRFVAVGSLKWCLRSFTIQVWCWFVGAGMGTVSFRETMLLIYIWSASPFDNSLKPVLSAVHLNPPSLCSPVGTNTCE